MTGALVKLFFFILIFSSSSSSYDCCWSSKLSISESSELNITFIYKQKCSAADHSVMTRYVGPMYGLTVILINTSRLKNLFKYAFLVFILTVYSRSWKSNTATTKVCHLAWCCYFHPPPIFTNYFTMTYLNVILHPPSESFKWLLSRRLLHQNSVGISSLSHLSYRYGLLSPHLFHYPNIVPHKHLKFVLKFSYQLN